jgi:hypothetical protein
MDLELQKPVTFENYTMRTKLDKTQFHIQRKQWKYTMFNFTSLILESYGLLPTENKKMCYKMRRFSGKKKVLWSIPHQNT